LAPGAGLKKRPRTKLNQEKELGEKNAGDKGGFASQKSVREEGTVDPSQRAAAGVSQRVRKIKPAPG